MHELRVVLIHYLMVFLSAVLLAEDLKPSTSATQKKPPPKYSLTNCINIALKNNKDILIAKKNLEGATGGIIIAQAGLLPSLDSSAAYTVTDGILGSRPDTSAETRQENWFVSLRLTQNIFSGGAVRSQVAIANLTKDSRFLDYQAAVDRTMFDVRTAFYEILLNKANIVVRQEAIDLLAEQLRDQKNREKVGEGNRLNVLRAEVALANEMPALIEAQNRWKDSHVRLSELLSVPYSTVNDQIPFEVVGSLEYRPQKFNFKDCLTKAEALRPETRIREKEIEILKEQLNVHQSAVLPKINVFLGYDVSAETSIIAPQDQTSGYTVGLAGSWQLFDGLLTVGQLQTTRARLAAAHLTRDATRRSIQSEVRQAFYELERAETTINSQAKNVNLAKETLTLATTTFDAGLSTQLDILQAHSDLTRARVIELSARYAYLVSIARLQRAVSSSFKILSDKTLSSKVPATDTIETERNSSPIHPTTQTVDLDMLTSEFLPKKSLQHSIFKKAFKKAVLLRPVTKSGTKDE